MSDHVTKLDGSGQNASESVTAAPLPLTTLPDLTLPTHVDVAHEPQKDREFIWVIIWALWSGLAAKFLDDGDEKRIVIQGIVGVIVGTVGGIVGEKYAGMRQGRDLIIYWTLFWAVTWALVYWIPIGCMWLLARLMGQVVEGMLSTSLLAIVFGVGVGTMGGAGGGWIRSRLMTKRQGVFADAKRLPSDIVNIAQDWTQEERRRQ
ncbi:MAG TPA: hypothetical protein VE988_12365 [Gemmataceae bacterium]|nr:hypothetical protein [Gemmataceae bacterium]